MGTLWNRSSSLEWDANAALADGALAYFYEAGTSTPKAVYSDGAESTAHEFPLEADGGRWPAVFIPFGSYLIVIKTAGGTTLFSADNVPNPEPFDETFEVDEDAQYKTGDYIFAGKNGTRSGAVRCNGRTIGSASSGATERANADTADLFAYYWDNYPSTLKLAVSGGAGATAAADFAAHKTIPTIDHRGAGLIGFDDMGNTAASLLGSAPVVSGSAILAGSIIGANTHVITEAQLAAHTHPFSATSGTESADHTHSISITSGNENVNHTHTATTSSDGAHTHPVSGGTLGGSANFPTGQGGGAQSFPSPSTGIVVDSGGAHTHTLTTATQSIQHTHIVSGTSAGKSATHTHTVSGTSGSTGSATAHNILSRAIPVTVLMKL